MRKQAWSWTSSSGVCHLLAVVTFLVATLVTVRAQAAPGDPVPTDVGDTAMPPGWKSPEAFKLASEAITFSEAAKYSECIDKDNASLKLDEQPRTRLHLAGCEYRTGKLKDALLHSNEALQLGIARRDAPLMKVAQERVKQLTERMPKITFVSQNGGPDLTVTFDGRPVPTDSLAKKFSIDPGTHAVKASGTLNGLPASFEESFEVKEREVFTSKLILKVESRILTGPQLKCIAEAKSQEEYLACLPKNQSPLVTKITTDLSGYGDTTRVNVFSPSISASIVSPTEGWNIAGSYLLDVVSAASPDIVSHASPPFKEIRHAGSLSAGKKFGSIGLQASGNVSREPDYLSLTGGIAATLDLNDKLLTPRIGYSYTNDTIRRGPTVDGVRDVPGQPFPRIFEVHQVDAGVAAVMSSTTVLVLGVNGQFERGDQSKPYRYVPMFAPNIAPLIKTGASVRTVDVNRLPIRPLEQLPTERDRYSLTVRLIKRIGTSATLRIDQRLYFDTWGTKATTTDARYLIDISKRVRVWPHLRFNYNTAVNFYKRAYVATTDVNGVISLPAYRSGDRELSPMASGTLGAGTHLGLGDLNAEVKFGLTASIDVMYSQFFDSLFVTRRTAGYSTIAFDVEF